MNPLSMAVVTAPKIEQKHDGQQEASVRSTLFDDVYFNPHQALANIRHDYIDGNDLLSRWQKNAGADCFVVAETGFGTGLNFLSTWSLWQQQAKKPRKLHFISCELHPIEKQQLVEILTAFPELQPQSDELLAHYPSSRAGFHRLHLSESVTLTLMFGDASQCLAQCHANVDAWFLDGFDPKKNPEMWSEDLYKLMARLSKKDSTVATFTASSAVRKGLLAAGFNVIKRKGFGRKREVITATKTEEVAAESPKQDWAPIKAANPHQKVVVLGGGIAGLSVVRAMAMAGQAVTLLDETEPMQGASGNEAGMVMPYLTAQSSPEALFYWRAFEYAVNAYETAEGCFQPDGIREWCLTDKKKQWANSLFANTQWPNDLIQKSEDSVFYPKAGQVRPRHVKSQWLGYADQIIQAKVSSIQHDGSEWQLLNANGQCITSCDVLVVTAGIHSLKFKPFSHLPLVPKHGQVSIIESEEKIPFQSIEKHLGYAIRLSDQLSLIGATFDHMAESDWFNEPELAQDHWQRNVQLWHEFTPWQWPEHHIVGGKAGIRTTTPDHLPVCGAMVDAESFAHDYADIHHGRHWKTYPRANTWPGLYLMTGLGARGFTSAPILGQLLSDMILGRPLPLELDLCKMLHPNRFLYKQLKKKRP